MRDQRASLIRNLQKRSADLSASKMAALASPCFFHKKFDKAVNLGKVMEEMSEDDTISHSRLVQTANSVREVSKQLQRRPIKMTVRNVMIVTKARDNNLVYLTRELAEWLMTTSRYGSDIGVNVYVDHKLRKSKRFDASQRQTLREYASLVDTRPVLGNPRDLRSCSYSWWRRHRTFHLVALPAHRTADSVLLARQPWFPYKLRIRAVQASARQDHVRDWYACESAHALHLHSIPLPEERCPRITSAHRS